MRTEFNSPAVCHMKRKCKTCDNIISTNIKLNGRWHVIDSRKHCLECVPFKSQRGPKPQPPNRICDTCKRGFLFRRRRGAVLNRCASCCATIRRREMKKRIVQLKGGSCIRCGYDKCIDVLSFHHREPAQKIHEVCGGVNRSFEANFAEAEKCDLLCANCHMEVHAEERALLRIR